MVYKTGEIFRAASSGAASGNIPCTVSSWCWSCPGDGRFYGLSPRQGLFISYKCLKEGPGEAMAGGSLQILGL